jgi:hypothetical protein
VCEGVPPFDFTQALRDANLNITVGQLMNMDKPPRAAIAKAFRSPRKAKNAKNAPAHLAEGVTATALVCTATVDGHEVSLILDSGSSLNIVAYPLLTKLGLKPIRSSTKTVMGIHGNRRLPMGEYDSLPVTVEGLTIPADVVVIDTNAYSLIVGNEWLTKARAKLDWDDMTVTLRWNQREVTVACQCWAQSLVTASPVESSDESDESEDEDGDDEDHEEADAYFARDSPEAVSFATDVALYPNRFTHGSDQYPRAYIDFLRLRERRKRHPAILPTYGTVGPEKKCRCGFFLTTADDVCEDCKRDDDIAAVFETVLLEEKPKPKVTESADLTCEQQQKLDQFLAENVILFAQDENDLGRTTVVQHHIDTGDKLPIRQRYYRASQAEKQFIESEIRRMLRQGLIRTSDSPWASPVVLVMKKNGKRRFCVDYRKLNAVTRQDAYPLPRIDDIFDSLGQAKWFTSLDLASGYWQVEVTPQDREKTAFITSFGIFEFNVMPFGLTNAPRTFQRLMDRVLREEIGRFVHVYLDDINIFSRTFDEHLQHLGIVLRRLGAAGLKLNPEKCEFMKKRLHFLGHVISEDGLGPDPAKVDKVRTYPTPKNVRNLRGFLGLASYYRRFVKDFSRKAAPLYYLTKKGVNYEWTDDQEAAFQELKTCLTTAPILAYPNFQERFILHTDASTVGLGAVLAQKNEEGREHVVAYASRGLNSAERNYSATELECLAVVWAVKQFRVYIYGQEFDLVTDHAALKWLVNHTAPHGRTARWVMQLQEFRPTIVYRKGATHQNADALSRIPQPPLADQQQ